MKDQTSPNIPLIQGQSRARPLSLNFKKSKRGEKAEEEKLEARRGWSMRFKERSHFHYVKVQGEATSADVEATANYPKNPGKIINGRK